MYKVETARFNFVSPDAEPIIAADGVPIHQSLSWQEYLQDVLSNGGTFIELRRMDEYQELTVAYRTAGAALPEPQMAPGQIPSDGTTYQAKPTAPNIDDLINGTNAFPF